MQHTVALPLSSARCGFTGTPAGTTQVSVPLDPSRFRPLILRSPQRDRAAVLPAPAGLHMRWRGSPPGAPDLRLVA